MHVREERGGVAVVAYRGDAKTMLAFDVAPDRLAGLAGFTVGYQVGAGGTVHYLSNMLRYAEPQRHAQVPGYAATSSINTPLHVFRWLHVPGAELGHPAEHGGYTYRVTPRYYADRRLQPIDEARTVTLRVDVAPFVTGAVTAAFTRGFVQSQAFVRRFGHQAAIEPADSPLLFDTAAPTGRTTPSGHPYTWAEEYAWLGAGARATLLDLLDGVRSSPDRSVDVFAYDLNEPDVVAILATLAGEGRLRLVLDDSALHKAKAGRPPTKEDEAAVLLEQAAVPPAAVKRGHFARYSHDKVVVVHDGGIGTPGRRARTVLTGSTNFSVTGLYVNSNHVLVLEDDEVAAAYAAVFQAAWDGDVKAPPFRATSWSQAPTVFESAGLPRTSITFAPHTRSVATEVLADIDARVRAEERGGSVLFAVMGIESGGGPLLRTLRELHESTELFTYGITDDTNGLHLYRHTKEGVVASGRPGHTRLPAPFDQVQPLAGPTSHQVHHKFVVCGFNGASPVVYCGSSNLAEGGETDNGDNLLALFDGDLATAFAIEAAALVDHFQFLDRRRRPGTAAGPDVAEPVVETIEEWFQTTGDRWTRPYYDPDDLKCTDRTLFANPL